MSKVRYINEHFTDSNPQRRSAYHAYIPQTPINKSYQGLKNLKQTEDYIDQIKRRLSLLEIRQQKNKQKMKDNYRKLKLHAEIQQSATQDKIRKLKHKQKMEIQLMQSRKSNNERRIRQKVNLKAICDGILYDRQQLFSRQKQRSCQFQMSIKKTKQMDKMNKAINRKKINQMEKRQRENIEEFFNHKKHIFRKNSEEEGRAFQSRNSERKSVLEYLTSIEAQMIQRQSNSRAALEESQRSLKKVSLRKKFSQREKTTNESTEKLAPLSYRQQTKKQQFILI